MGKNMIEEKIQEEASDLLRELEKYNDKTIDPSSLLNTAVSNIICSIVFGQRYEYSDKEMCDYLKMINFSVTKARGAILATDVFPFLQYLPGDLFSIKKIVKNQQKLMEFIQGKIDQHKDTLNPDNIRSFIDAYLVEINKRGTADTGTTFTGECIIHVITCLA
jgi:hypothetical protein